MSKELTEQLQNGTLEENMYYVKLPEEIVISNLYRLKQLALVNDSDEIEVLAPVPTYNQFSKMVKKVERLEQQLESETLAKQEGVEIVSELQQKVHILNEANMNLENAIASQAEYFRQQISVLEDIVKELKIKICAYESGVEK